MKIKNLFFALLALPLFFVACEENQPTDEVKAPTVTITPGTAGDTTLSFTIESTNATTVAYLVVEGENSVFASEILADGTAVEANKSVTVTAEGLKESTKYTIAVAAQNSKSSKTETITMTTTAAVAPGPDPGEGNNTEFTATHIFTRYENIEGLHYYYFELGNNTWDDDEWGVAGGTYYAFEIISNTKGNGVLPNGTYPLAETYSAGTINIDYSYFYQIDENGEMVDSMKSYKDANVIITDGKIEANIEFENGDVHHVVFEGNLTVGDGGTQIPTEFEATHTADKWYWGGTTADWGNKYAVSGEGFSIDVHFPVEDATETTLSTGLYTWCVTTAFGSTELEYREFTTRTFIVDGVSVAVDAGTATVEAEGDVYHIELTLQGRDGNVYMIEYTGKLNDKGEVGETDTNLVINTLSKGSIYSEYHTYIIKFVAEGENFSFDLLLNNETAQESQIVAGDYFYVTSKGNLNTPGYFYIENFYLDGTKYSVSGASLSVVTEDTKNVELTLNIATVDGSEFVVTYTGLVGGNEGGSTELVKLDTPTLVGMVAGNAVTISWNEIAGAKDYTVTLNGSDTKTVSTAYVVYENLAWETTYSVSVVANPADEAVNAASDAGTTTFTTEVNPNPEEGGDEGDEGNEGGSTSTATLKFVKDLTSEYGSEYTMYCYYELTSGADIIGFWLYNLNSDKKYLPNGEFTNGSSINHLAYFPASGTFIEDVTIDGQHISRTNNHGSQTSSTIVIENGGANVTINLDYVDDYAVMKNRKYTFAGVVE